MKLLVFFSLAALVANDFVASAPEPPTDTYNAPEKTDAVEDAAAPTPTPKPFFDFKNFYHGAFPPATFPPSNFRAPAPFSSFNYPLGTFNYAPFRQGILPPFSQILPPQISQIVPPIFSNSHPSLPLPLPPPSLPSQSFPPQILPPVTKPLLNKFTFPQPRPLTHFPSTLSTTFPSLYSFPPPNFFPLQAQPPTAHKESLPTSYGPPQPAPEQPEPAGPAETSAAFEPSPISYPYEPALPEEPEPAPPHKPAQEYGPPSSK